MSFAIETVRSTFKTELETIQAGAVPATGISVFRNTVNEVREDLIAVPKLGITLTLLFNGGITLKPINSQRSTYDLLVPFTIVCDIDADTSTGTTSNLIAQQDSLTQDIFKVFSILYTKYINSNSTNIRWNLMEETPIMVSPLFSIQDASDKREFDITGRIHIRALTGSFE